MLNFKGRLSSVVSSCSTTIRNKGHAEEVVNLDGI